MNHNKDYYEILGIDADASVEKIKESYRRLAFEYHPDRNNGDAGAVEKMKELNEAYAVLSDSEKRATYDRVKQTYGANSAYDHFRQTYSEQDIFRGSDINKVFEEMARAFGFRGFEEVFRGAYGQGYRTFEFRRPGVFGKFIIFGSPFGVSRTPEVGSQPMAGSLLGKAAGYLLKKAFGLETNRNGKDMYDVINLDPAQAVNGGKVKYVDSKRGKEFIITVPSEVRDGQKIRLKGMGGPAKNGGIPGDLYLSVAVRKPLLEKVRSFLKI
jgi:DnaJ-class molecular chaperone